MKKISLFLILTVSFLSCNQQTTPEDQFDKNFVHTVFFWFNDPDNTEERAAFEKSLYKFLDNSEYAKTNYLGTPANTPRDVVDNSYTYVLIVTFDSKEAQDLYQKEAVHLTFIEESKHLWNKVLIYDSVGI